MAHPPLLAGMPLTAARMNTLMDYGSYDPVLTALTTNPNIGTGVVDGWWYRQGLRIIGGASIRFGSTGASAGSGDYRVSLPFDAHPTLNDFGFDGYSAIIGSGFVRDDSAAATSRVVTCSPANASTVAMNVNGSSVAVGAASPFAWTSQDAIAIRFDYIADPADLPDEPVSQNHFRDGYPVPGRTVEFLDKYVSFSPRIELGTTDEYVNFGDDSEAVGWYRRTWKFVEGAARIRFNGSGIDLGGSLTISMLTHLPFQADGLIRSAVNPGFGHPIGDGRIRDNDTAANSKLVTISSSSTDYYGDGVPVGRMTAEIGWDGSNVGMDPDNPIPWAANDRISFRFAYITELDGFYDLEMV